MSLPTAVRPEEITRERTLAGALALCAKVGGYELDKQLQQELQADKAQFSRWMSGTEGILWPKLERLMDACGNDAPVLWMAHQRGIDLYSLRLRESETDRQNRLLREENDALKRVLLGRSANA